jgi:PIN domain nuclease of toxin-antitoxin system
MKVFLDTYACIFLLEGDEAAFGKRAKQELERAALFISPLVRLEFAYLHEIHRINHAPDRLLSELTTAYGVTEASDPIQEIVAEAMALTWTRDPFDRLIVATAKLHRAPLITQDQTILEHFENAVW